MPRIINRPSLASRGQGARGTSMSGCFSACCVYSWANCKFPLRSLRVPWRSLRVCSCVVRQHRCMVLYYCLLHHIPLVAQFTSGIGVCWCAFCRAARGLYFKCAPRCPWLGGAPGGLSHAPPVAWHCCIFLAVACMKAFPRAYVYVFRLTCVVLAPVGFFA